MAIWDAIQDCYVDWDETMARFVPVRGTLREQQMGKLRATWQPDALWTVYGTLGSMVPPAEDFITGAATPEPDDAHPYDERAPDVYAPTVLPRIPDGPSKGSLGLPPATDSLRPLQPLHRHQRSASVSCSLPQLAPHPPTSLHAGTSHQPWRTHRRHVDASRPRGRAQHGGPAGRSCSHTRSIDRLLGPVPKLGSTFLRLLD